MTASGLDVVDTGVTEDTEEQAAATTTKRRKRRRRRRSKTAEMQGAVVDEEPTELAKELDAAGDEKEETSPVGEGEAKPKRRRPKRRPSSADAAKKSAEMEDEEEDADESGAKYKNVPTWEEAISYLKR
ncbi:MAG TPA: hypothetical protein EYP14_05660 [Planctomycetaceae bacterium]|nr:hypothetical protein [Planctomycetaceae bacterium]